MSLASLLESCFAGRDAVLLGRQQGAAWEPWLAPISEQHPAGEDPAYTDDFQRMREEVDKLSGGNAEHVVHLAQMLFKETCKDLRVALAPEPVSPVTLDLQSLWLFAPGSAELDAGSTSSLVKALVQIQAQPPGRLIVISGHADATGNTQRNQLLSQQRAQAVRDWLQRMGGFADSCFVVQGQGSAKPLEGNVAMAGQGLNRRVDIRLVAVEGGCAASL
jgi:outer membrane protein OmpA-like peptidoglycan-associated protein